MSEVSSKRPRLSLAYLAWLTATLTGVFAILGVVGWLASARGVSGSLPPMLLKIEPPVLDLGEAGFVEGSPVKGSFRLVNTSSRPLTIVALRTSCSCLASVADGGKSPPFVIEPSSSAMIRLATTASSMQGLHQNYSLTVEAGPDEGKSLFYEGTMSFNVLDSLKADPTAIRAYDDDPLSPKRSSIVLYTFRDSREIPEPTVRVLAGADQIEAKVIKLGPTPNHDLKTLPRYEVQLSFLPSAETELISGSVEIATAGEPTLTVPCSIRFRREQSVEPDHVNVAGKPGQAVERRLFQQFRLEDWRDPRVVEKPEGCRVEIQRFDDQTNLIVVQMTMPSIGEAGSRPNDRIILSSRGGGKTASIPVRYDSEE